MNRTTMGLIALALVVLSGVALGFQPTTVQGPKPEKAQQWEYKILTVIDLDFSSNKAEEQFNKLAADGWEFSQILVSRGPGTVGAGQPLSNTTCFLFKRAKK